MGSEVSDVVVDLTCTMQLTSGGNRSSGPESECSALRGSCRKTSQPLSSWRDGLAVADTWAAQSSRAFCPSRPIIVGERLIGFSVSCLGVSLRAAGGEPPRARHHTPNLVGSRTTAVLAREVLSVRARAHMILPITHFIFSSLVGFADAGRRVGRPAGPCDSFPGSRADHPSLARPPASTSCCRTPGREPTEPTPDRRTPSRSSSQLTERGRPST
jgi:hypothetical protein